MNPTPWRVLWTIVAALALAVGMLATLSGRTGGNQRMVDAAPAPAAVPAGKELATLAGGCFWCTEALFQELKGVEKVEPGYSGGTTKNPSYEQVCTGLTGHAEAVQITFDPKVISFADLVRIFLTIHDPTTLNRQGPDTGAQYRSAIFYHSDAQKKAAHDAIAETNKAKVWNQPIVTEVTAFTTFYPAEEYHHNYFLRNQDQSYCRIMIEPKVAKLREHYRERLKK